MAARVLVAALGAVVVVAVVLSAVRTVVLPRGVPVWLTNTVFRLTAWPFRLAAAAVSRLPGGGRRAEGLLALYAPVTLLMVSATWLAATTAGFAALMWAVGEGSAARSLDLSGSSVVTLGTLAPRTAAGAALGVAEAALAISFLVLVLVTYLPSMYSAFRDREREVALVNAWAGTPPTGLDMLVRSGRIGGLASLGARWRSWQGWFVDLGQSHTSLGPLLHFRSIQPEQDWVTACGTLLDAAALAASVVDLDAVPDATAAGINLDVPRGELGTDDGVARGRAQGSARWADAEMMVRVGAQSLVTMVVYAEGERARDDDPHLRREEMEAACDRLAAAGVPVVADRDAAWADLVGWRRLYAGPLLDLARLSGVTLPAWSVAAVG